MEAYIMQCKLNKILSYPLANGMYFIKNMSVIKNMKILQLFILTLMTLQNRDLPTMTLNIKFWHIENVILLQH